jgi:alkylation response protein AidB-like acyl-CoA dehydrogenase
MFQHTTEQEEIQRAARAFVRERLPVAHLRGLRDRDEPARLSREVWQEAARLGWAGILIGEADGGAGLGLVEAGLILEECGRTLAPTPLLATAVLGAGALAGAPAALRREVLPAVGRGERLLALAFEERPRFAPEAIATTARRVDGGWRLDGHKVHVLDGAAADQLVVVADAGAFLIDRDAPGLVVQPLAMVDSRGAARLRLDGVVVPEARALGALALAPLLDRATAALAAEMLGGADEVFATTLAYLKTRRQFGVPIGSFQALKHRAAHLHGELELTRSVVLAALAALDAGDPEAPVLVSAAKAKASATFLHAAAEAIQLHGGIGVTDDLDVGLYYKRAQVAAATFGDAAYHRARFASLQGY